MGPRIPQRTKNFLSTPSTGARNIFPKLTPPLGDRPHPLGANPGSESECALIAVAITQKSVVRGDSEGIPTRLCRGGFPLPRGSPCLPPRVTEEKFVRSIQPSQNRVDATKGQSALPLHTDRGQNSTERGEEGGRGLRETRSFERKLEARRGIRLCANRTGVFLTAKSNKCSTQETNASEVNFEHKCSIGNWTKVSRRENRLVSV